MAFSRRRAKQRDCNPESRTQDPSPAARPRPRLDLIALPRLFRAVAILMAILLLGGASSAMARQEPETGKFRLYQIRLAETNLIVAAGTDEAGLISAPEPAPPEELVALFDELAAAGLAGAYTFDPVGNAFRAELRPEALDRLGEHPLVAAVEPLPEGATLDTAGRDLAGLEPLPPPSVGSGAQAVSSIVFVQVYSPFMWGRTNVGGLSVELTLEDSTGAVKGVAYQTTRTTSDNYVKIDRTQLYYETYFVDPDDPAHAPVMILPGDRVHVVTSGIDPGTGQPATEDKRVVVDDVRAWTSYEQDTVSGTTTPNLDVIVTVGSLNLSQYLTPGTSMTYAELKSNTGGGFSTSSFRTSSDSTPKTVDLKQGSTGFVRVRHPDGSEVYTVHGQNVLVLENSSVVHGWAFQLPQAPPNLDSGVAIFPRPATRVTATLKSAGGQVKATKSGTSGFDGMYAFSFAPATISGGDIVEVSINDGPINRAATVPLTARIDLNTNQVIGTGPANTQMVLGAGRISGYITSSSFADFVQKRVPTNASGSYASGGFQCGTSSTLLLRPGSFGYSGYEDANGNFIYMAFAAPTTHVMVDYPFLEGWLANGALRPQVTVRAQGGALKHQSTGEPLLLWMLNQKLYINTYHNMQASQFIVPGDTVTVVAGSRTDTIPVERLTAYVDTDAEAVVGEAPAGAALRVVPVSDRSARREVVSPANGAYTANNPFTVFSNFNCSETTTAKDFKPGDAGRVYLRHADGNEVFVSYGRSMHVNQNENYVELFLYATRDLDWYPTPQRTATVTITPTQGLPLTVDFKADFGRPGKTRVYLTDGAGQRVIIRAGDRLRATFDEGPDGVTRPVALAVGPMALVTGSPDVEASTLAGVGPRSWGGQALLNPPPSSKPVLIPTRSSTAYAPLQFLDWLGNPVPLVRGYSGTVSFSDRTGTRIWSAWAATTYPVKIAGWLAPGDTRVCGTAAPGSTVRIHDATIEGQTVILGTGTSNADGQFCVTVSPPLYRLQVVLAEADGTYSQPVIVDYLPPTAKLSAAAYTVREEGSSATITVTLSATSVQTVTLDYATANGSAGAGSDYTATNGTLTIPPGKIRGTITVPITDDTLSEPDETFNITLSNPVNAFLGSPASATVTIRDNDRPPSGDRRLWLPVIRR